MTLKISGWAAADLDRGWVFYDQQESGLGEYFFRSVASDIESLPKTGGTHRIVFGFHRLLCSRFPYAVYYRLVGNEVTIWRVLDCRRNPARIRRSLGA